MPVSSYEATAPRVLAGAALVVTCVGVGWALAVQASLPLLAVGALAFVAVALVFAELGLTSLWMWAPLSVIAYPLTKYLPGSPFVSFDHLWLGGMAVLLLTLPTGPRHSLPTHRLLLAVGTLAALIGLRAVLTTTGQLYAIRTWLDALLLPLVLFLVVRRATILDPRRTGTVALTLAVAGTILGAIGLAEHVFGFELASLSGSTARVEDLLRVTRVSGTYDVPETYGLSLVLCLAATMYWIQLRGRAMVVLGTAMVALELGGIAFTYFRVAWVSALIVILMALAFRPRHYGRPVLVLAALGLVLAVAVTQLEQVSAFSERAKDTQNYSSRLASYKQGTEIWREHPLFGVGFGRYNSVAVDRPPVQVNGIDSQPNPHSSYFGTLAEDGIFALLALLWSTLAVWRLVRALNRRRREPSDVLLAASVSGAAIAYLLFSVTLGMLPYSPSNLFLAVLLGLAAARVDLLAGPREGPAGQSSRAIASPSPRLAKADAGR